MSLRVISTAAAASLLASVAVIAQSSPVFTAEDVLAVRTFAGGQAVAVSTDGWWIAYALTDLDDEWNVQEPRPTSHVTVQPMSGKKRLPSQRSGGIIVVSHPRVLR